MKEEQKEGISPVSKTIQVDDEEGKIRKEEAKLIKIQKRVIEMNIVVISFAFMLLFTAYQSVAFLQSSINKVNCKEQWFPNSFESRTINDRIVSYGPYKLKNFAINGMRTGLRKTLAHHYIVPRT